MRTEEASKNPAGKMATRTNGKERRDRQTGTQKGKARRKKERKTVKIEIKTNLTKFREEKPNKLRPMAGKNIPGT